MLRNNADARRCSYFELGLPVFTDPLFSLRVRRAHVKHGLLRDAILNFQGKSSGSEVASRSDQKRIIKPAYS